VGLPGSGLVGLPGSGLVGLPGSGLVGLTGSGLVVPLITVFFVHRRLIIFVFPGQQNNAPSIKIRE